MTSYSRETVTVAVLQTTVAAAAGDMLEVERKPSKT